jgi:hypothetical protein
MDVRERLKTKFVANYNYEKICEMKRIKDIAHSGENNEGDLEICLLCRHELPSISWCNIYECCGGILCDNCSNNALKEYISENHESAMRAFNQSIDDDLMGASIEDFLQKDKCISRILRCPQCRDSQKSGPVARLGYLRGHLDREQPWAYYALSIAYRDGENGVPEDCEEGWKICQKGCEKEYPALQFLWAQAQFKGKFGDFELISPCRVNHSPDHYIGTLEAAAKGGHPGAQDLLAYHYWYGIGTPLNKAEAIKSFRLSLATQFDFHISETRTRNSMCMDEDTSFFHKCLQDLLDDKSSLGIHVNVILFWAVQQLKILGPQLKVLEDLLRVLSKGIELLHSDQEGEVQVLRTEYKYIRRSVFKSLIEDIDFQNVLKETCASCGSCSRDESNQLKRCKGW